MFEELDKPLKYVIFTILYIEIFSLMFNQKIKVQMMICALVLTAIASISIVIDMHKGIGDGKLSWMSFSFIPQTIKDQNASAPIGWFIGLIALMNIFAMGIITKIEYSTDSKQKLSNKNAQKLQRIKYIFISIVASVTMMCVISFFLFNAMFKNRNALMFLAAYTFGASVYTLDTSRKLHKLFVNGLIAN
jgi:hypothetical protein